MSDFVAKMNLGVDPNLTHFEKKAKVLFSQAQELF